jgi:hypothetical protein
MKIKVVSNYDTDKNMFRTMKNCHENNTRLKLTEADDYDYMVVINGHRGNINVPRENVIGILQEPIGNINYDRNLHLYCNKIICQSRDMFRGYNGIIESPMHMFYTHHCTIERKKFINFTDFNKRKKLCVIMSSLSHPNNTNWTNHNYQKRHSFIKKMLNTDIDFDFYGRGWRNINDIRYKGETINKHDTIRKYEYSIAIENVCEKNYASEKLFDCFLNNTVPFYYGCPNVDEIYDPKSYIIIDIEDSDTISKIREEIKKDNLFYKDSVLKSKEIYFNKLNIFNLINENINEYCH